MTTLATKKIIFVVIIAIVSQSCTDVPTVKTEKVTKIDVTQAVSGGDVLDDRYSDITERGVCWSKQHMPTITDSISISGWGLGPFTADITQLKPYTSYYVRAYATNNVGTGYGQEVKFTTKNVVIAPINFNPSVNYGSMVDQDGNTYKTVTIGTQTWMAENLKTTKYRNGDPVPNITDTKEWKNLKTGAYCDYVNYSKFSEIYGHLYNWYAVNDNRNLAPEGWHIPSKEEWALLVSYVGGAYSEGNKLKESGSSHWNMSAIPNPGATNESGFTALPGGLRERSSFIGYELGYSFISLGWAGYWWTSTENPPVLGTLLAEHCSLSESDGFVALFDSFQDSGHSVRCVKD